MKNLFCFFLFLSIGASAQTINDKVISKIAFGSCVSQDNPQDIWYKVIEEKPELFILLGDNIYGDTKDMAVLQKKYDQFGSKPGYIELQKQTPVIATWDDHDYGVNDGGKEYPMKEESKKSSLNFLKNPKTLNAGNTMAFIHPICMV